MAKQDWNELPTPSPVRVEAPAETSTVAAWGEKKGLLPQWLGGGGARGERRLNPEYWKLAAAVAFKRWELTEQVAEAEFDAAVSEIQNHVHR